MKIKYSILLICFIFLTNNISGFCNINSTPIKLGMSAEEVKYILRNSVNLSPSDNSMILGDWTSSFKMAIFLDKQLKVSGWYNRELNPLNFSTGELSPSLASQYLRKGDNRDIVTKKLGTPSIIIPSFTDRGHVFLMYNPYLKDSKNLKIESYDEIWGYNRNLEVSLTNNAFEADTFVIFNEGKVYKTLNIPLLDVNVTPNPNWKKWEWNPTPKPTPLTIKYGMDQQEVIGLFSKNYIYQSCYGYSHFSTLCYISKDRKYVVYINFNKDLKVEGWDSNDPIYFNFKIGDKDLSLDSSLIIGDSEDIVAQKWGAPFRLVQLGSNSKYDELWDYIEGKVYFKNGIAIEGIDGAVLLVPSPTPTLAPTPTPTPTPTPIQIFNINYGMSEQSVISILGENYSRNEKEFRNSLIYSLSYKYGKSTLKSNPYIKIYFDSESKVIGWQNNEFLKNIKFSISNKDGTKLNSPLFKGETRDVVAEKCGVPDTLIPGDDKSNRLEHLLYGNINRIFLKKDLVESAIGYIVNETPTSPTPNPTSKAKSIPKSSPATKPTPSTTPKPKSTPNTTPKLIIKPTQIPKITPKPTNTKSQPPETLRVTFSKNTQPKDKIISNGETYVYEGINERSRYFEYKEYIYRLVPRKPNYSLR